MNKEELKKKIREIVHNHQDGVVFQELENSCVNELTVLFTEIEEKTKRGAIKEFAEWCDKQGAVHNDGHFIQSWLEIYNKLNGGGK